jgi:hypothetical protein
MTGKYFRIQNWSLSKLALTAPLKTGLYSKLALTEDFDRGRQTAKDFVFVTYTSKIFCIRGGQMRNPLDCARFSQY